MLDKLRDPTRTRSPFKKVFYGILFALIIAAFVFMSGAGSPVGGSAGGKVAVVNGKVITHQDFNRQYTSEENRIRQQAKGLPAALRQQYMKGLSQQVVERMINMELARQLATESGIFVSANEIRDEISSIPSFQENGQFQASRYQQLLQANRMNTSAFEDNIKGSIAFERFRNIFTNSVKATSEDVELTNFARSQKINVEYLEISQNLLKKNIVVSDAEIAAYNTSEAAKVKKYYEDNKADYTSKEKTKASHILIKTKSQKDEDYKVALDKIKKIRTEITDTNFAEMAKKYSEDGSKSKGGDLGEFDKDVRFVAPFKEAALTLPVGKLSEPIKTQFGYHLIKVTGKTPGGVKSLDEVKNSIAKQFISDKKVQEDMESLSKGESGVDMAAINKIKDKYNVKWQNTGLFSLEQKNIPKLGDRDKVWDAISDLIGKEGSKLIESDGKYFVVKLKDSKFEPVKVGDMESQIAQLSQSRSGDAVQSFIENEAKRARIKRYSTGITN